MKNLKTKEVNKGGILIADDDLAILNAFESMLSMAGYGTVYTCLTGLDAAEILKKKNVEVVIADYYMPGVGDEHLLDFMGREYPEIPVVIITGEAEIEIAVCCMKKGAADYLQKPIEEERMLSVIGHILAMGELRHENEILKKHLRDENMRVNPAFSSILTVNRTMLSIFQYLESIGPTAQPVLISGETGVGKELFARAIHKVSGRDGKFVAVNIAGLDDHLFSDTLFGHTRGAFTGADKARAGMVEIASRGTLFLDEIGDLSQSSQIKLLRLLQEKEYVPLGADNPVASTARIVAATNISFHDAISQGIFRKDLFYRLRPHQIRIPSLKERLDDLPVLVKHFINKASVDLGKKPPAYPDELVPLLSTYSFPGNVRELEGLIYDALGRHTSRVLSLTTFKQYLRDGNDSLKLSSIDGLFSGTVIFPEILPDLKKIGDLLVDEAMRRSGGNQSLAAELLGITHQALSKRLKIRKHADVG